MAEFIAANDLPITETSEVDVLCVEHGELKRKPVASLGGGGGGGYVIHVKEEEVSQETGGIVIQSAESFDNYAELLYNGGSVWIDLTVLGMPIYAQATLAAFAEEDGVFMVSLMSIIPMDTLSIIALNATNGTWRPPVA